MIRRTQPETMAINAAQECQYIVKKAVLKSQNEQWHQWNIKAVSKREESKWMN